MSKVHEDDLLGMVSSSEGGGTSTNLTWEDINENVTIKAAEFQVRDATVGVDGSSQENCSFKLSINGGYTTFIQTDNPYAYDYDAKENGTAKSIEEDRLNRLKGFMQIIKTFVPMEIIKDVFSGLEGTNAKLEAGAQLLTKHGGEVKAYLKMYPKFRKNQREFFPIIPVWKKAFVEPMIEGKAPWINLHPKWDIEKEIQRELDYGMNWMKDNPEEEVKTEEVSRKEGEPDLGDIDTEPMDELEELQ